MSFLTTSLLAGAAFVALPIILHLVMRREPRLLEFPALRFIQQRRSTNQTRMQLQHWLLLALRCAAIALLAVALARPVLRGSGLKGGETGLVSAALVFDNSPRMAYREAGQTRLDKARELGDWLLEQLPADSQVAVLDRGSRRGKRLGDRDAGQLRVGRLAIGYAPRSIEEAVRDAIDLLEEREGDRREVYIFTDLAAAAWPEATRAAVTEQLGRLEDVQLFVVDVGGEEAANRGVGAVRLDSAVIATGGTLGVTADLYRMGGAGEPIIAQLWLGQAEKGVKRGEAIVTPAAGESAEAAFAIGGLDEGTHQGRIEIASGDPLPEDDVRYFTFRVEPPRPVLIAAVDETRALFVDQALAPSGPAGESSGYETQVITFRELQGTALDDYRAVWLLDPPALEANLWRKLDSYARGGGSVAIALGRNARSKSFNQAQPQRLLAGPLLRRSRDATYLRPLRYDHPALRGMADFAEAIPWQQFPVFQSWELDTLSDGTLVVAPFANGQPAIVERSVGRGRAMTFTTPLSDPASNDPWNLLPTGPDPWPFLALMNNVSGYLVGLSEARLIYAAGETATLPVPPGTDLSSYVLDLPTGESIKQAQPGMDQLVVGATGSPGNYRVRAGAGRLDAGFSVNSPANVGQLTRINADELIESLQAANASDRVRFARSRDQLARQVDIGRVGREVYPWLIALMAMAFAAEQVISNRFYKHAE